MVESAGPAAVEAMVVDADGMRFADVEADVVDVLFDGQRVWSVATDELEPDDDGFLAVEWPEPIRVRLAGEALVELRDHVSGEPVHSVEHRFGSAEGRVRLVDSAGRQLALTKWGRLHRPFEATDRAVIEEYLDRVEDVLRVLSDDCRVPGFLSFGTLLGAVREGKLIGHDVDVDLGYFSRHSNPVDAVRESFDIERAMRAHGWKVLRHNGGFLAVNFPQAGGGQRNVDIFTCLRVEGSVYEVNDIGVVADVDVVLPLRLVELEGRRWPAPADPTVFLQAAYGPGWRVPDPTFSFDTARATKRRIEGWTGGVRGRRDFWRFFYQRPARRRVPQQPTGFARWMVSRERPCRVLELGFGNGRDTLFLAAEGFDVHGVEVVAGQVGRVANAAKRRDLTVTLEARNFESLRDTLAAGAWYSRRIRPNLVYARFLLHALTEDGRAMFWRLAAMSLRGGGRCYLEFRTTKDAVRPKEFGDHFRNFLNPDVVAAEAADHGGRVIHREEGTGLAVFGREDAHVCRLVLEW